MTDFDPEAIDPENPSPFGDRLDDFEETAPASAQGAQVTGGHHDNPDVLTVREIRAVELRKAGLNYQQIAQALGYANKGGAYKAVHRALRKWGQPVTEEYRILELARLDAITSRLWAKGLGRPGRAGGVNDDGTVVEPLDEIEPDYQALNILLKTMERRARLLGLDAQGPLEPEPEGTSEAQLLIDDYEAFTSAIEELARLELEHSGHQVIPGEVVEQT
jgi:hypothetical protein